MFYVTLNEHPSGSSGWGGVLADRYFMAYVNSESLAVVFKMLGVLYE